MVANTAGKYANVGEIVIFSDRRFNYQLDSSGKLLKKEPSTAGAAFVAVRQKNKGRCDITYDSIGIERTVIHRSDLISGSFALKAVFHEIKYGEWKSSNASHVIFLTRSNYLYEPLASGRIYKWKQYGWMVKAADGVLSERLNKDLWEDILNILNNFEDIGIKVETMFLEKDNYFVLNTLVENPIAMALEASNGNRFMKDEGFEKTYWGQKKYTEVF